MNAKFFSTNEEPKKTIKEPNPPQKTEIENESPTPVYEAPKRKRRGKIFKTFVGLAILGTGFSILESKKKANETQINDDERPLELITDQLIDSEISQLGSEKRIENIRQALDQELAQEYVIKDDYQNRKVEERHQQIIKEIEEILNMHKITHADQYKDIANMVDQTADVIKTTQDNKSKELKEVEDKLEKLK